MLVALVLPWVLITSPGGWLEVMIPVESEKACYERAHKMHLPERNFDMPGYICWPTDRLEHKDPYDPL